MENSGHLVSGRYLAILCTIALLILVAGVLLRPQNVPAPVRSQSESLQIQLLAQKSDLQRRSLFFESKATKLVGEVQPARANPSQYTYRRPAPGTVVLVVGTNITGRPVWASASTAGTTTVSCQGEAIEEIGTTIFIPATLAGGAAFDLDDNLSGFVVECGERRILTTLDGFTLLSQQTIADALSECCRLRSAPVAEGPGRRIVELGRESQLFRTGVRVGDTVLEMNGAAVESDEDLRPLTADGPLQLVVRRNEVLRRFTLPGAEYAAGASVRPSGAGVEVLRVDPDTPAAAVGIKSGDRVIRAGAAGRVQPARLASTLQSEPPGEIVVQRGQAELLLGGGR